MLTGTCPHRSPPLYGKYTRVQLRKTTWLVNDEAVYVCKDGYVLSRRGNPRCLSTGRWSHDIPVCEKSEIDICLFFLRENYRKYALP